MLTILNGKFFIRSLASEHVLVGAITVPESMEGELMYPALVDPAGRALIDPKPGNVTITNAQDYDINALSVSLHYRGGAQEYGMDLFIRDTEIPSRQPGYKWVIAMGGSRMHGALPSTVMEFGNGEFSTYPMEFTGMNLSQVMGEPLWGYKDDPYALFHTLNLDCARIEIPRMRKELMESDPLFKRFVERVNDEFGEQKSCYTSEDMKRRAQITSRIYREISQAAAQEATSPRPSI